MRKTNDYNKSKSYNYNNVRIQKLFPHNHFHAMEHHGRSKHTHHALLLLQLRLSHRLSNIIFEFCDLDAYMHYDSKSYSAQGWLLLNDKEILGGSVVLYLHRRNHGASGGSSHRILHGSHIAHVQDNIVLSLDLQTEIKAGCINPLVLTLFSNICCNNHFHYFHQNMSVQRLKNIHQNQFKGRLFNNCFDHFYNRHLHNDSGQHLLSVHLITSKDH